jgi:2,4-dienoyl-CoA reductase-like NADH-dependent reductase (Old Yellow Enzyme family)/thioredoxin reductase
MKGIEMKFEKLFEPIQIKGVAVPNRLVMSAACTEYGTEDGYVTDRMINYYAERAKGGTGLIFIEVANPIYPSGKVLVHQLAISDDKYIPDLKRLTDAIHSYGAKTIVQISHAGRQTTSKVSGAQPIAPSAILPKVSMYWEQPREMTLEEIKAFPQAFDDATLRAKKAGFDGIELHLAHGYLLTSFISPYTNKRTDEYGGSLENRMRLPLETLRACAKHADENFLICVRINGDDYVEGGVTLDEAKQIAEMCVDNGTDLVSVSAGMRESTSVLQDHSPAVERGAWVYLAEAIKEHLGDVPVIAAKRINRPEMAENILRQTNIDMVAMLRGLMADPHVMQKTKEGRLNDIVTCIACCQGCYGRLWEHLPIMCTVNPLMGREKEWTTEPAKKKKKILVVGGGPGGMEAALIARERGHDVTLAEKKPRLGGQWLLSLRVPHKYEFENTITELNYKMNKAGVKIELGTEVTPDYVEKMKPDAVILASGVIPVTPAIPGVEKRHVVQSFDVLDEIVLVGKRVVVIGAGRVGLETAEYLRARDREVIVLSRRQVSEIGQDLPWPQGGHFLRRLDEMGVKKQGKVRVQEITDDGVVCSIDGKNEFLPADTVVLALGADGNSGLAKAFQTTVPELHLIGDCIEARNCLEAIHEGYKVSMTI